MAMIINTNMGSLNAVRQLDATSREQSMAMERLTSGLRINSSADDAAGLAVSESMTLQIRGTSMAIRNANDGISIAQTIDGATEEVVSMLQRMRELGVQSMNDTYSDENRLQMDAEFQQLKTEIDRISATTKFNGLNIMADANGVDIQAGWETTGKDIITVNTMNMATSALGEQFEWDTVSLGAPAGIDADGDSYRLNVGATILGGAVALQVDYGETVNGVEVRTAKQANDAMAFKINNDATLIAGDLFAEVDQAGLLTLKSYTGDLAATDLANNGSLVDVAVITDDATAIATATVNTDQFVAAGIDTLDLTTIANSKLAVDSIDSALTDVNNYRANVGATQNRIEYTISNLSNVNENMEAARSAIKDADYATESANLARTQVLQQAGMSMLSQANQTSQNVLQLLQ